MTVRFGVDVLCANPSLLGPVARVGLITNDAARLATDPGRHARTALLAAGVPLIRLFAPEHGLQVEAADGAAVDDGVDARTGLPIVSLYGERLRPPPDLLADLDVLLFDVPDVGARFYTYTWTLFHALATCAATGTRLVVLDRPNPLSGDLALAEGPTLEPACRSFVGEDAIPVRHQLTLGELALLWQRERWVHAPLTVVPCSGWSRTMNWPATGLPWVPTSPSMPEAAGALVYPGTCLFEATNVSVARGTDAPFMQIGAPWLDAERVKERFATYDMPGVRLHTVSFVPSLAPQAGADCHGVRLQITDARAFRPVCVGLLLLATVASTHPHDFQWARYPTAANPGGEGHLERLTGRRDVAAQLRHAPRDVDLTTVRTWTETSTWRARVADVLRYD